MKHGTIAVFLAFLGLMGGVVYSLNWLVTQSQPVWRDFGTVQNLHNIPEWTWQGAQYFQRMTIQTDSNGQIVFDTGPQGNSCTGMTIFSCGSRTVGWSNGTRVFVEKRQDGKFFVGAINS